MVEHFLKGRLQPNCLLAGADERFAVADPRFRSAWHQGVGPVGGKLCTEGRFGWVRSGWDRMRVPSGSRALSAANYVQEVSLERSGPAGIG